MKKRISVLMLALCLIIAFCGCSIKFQKSFTFSVETGDKVCVELDTTGGYDISSDLPFKISKDGSVLSQGTFIEAEWFEYYAEAANTDPDAKVIETNTKDSNQYVFWVYDNSQYNYTILVGDSDTGILLGNDVSEESARECFDRLTISLEE